MDGIMFGSITAGIFELLFMLIAAMIGIACFAFWL